MGMNFFGIEKSGVPPNSNAFYKRTFNRRRSFSKKNVPVAGIAKRNRQNPNLTQIPGY